MKRWVIKNESGLYLWSTYGPRTDQGMAMISYPRGWWGSKSGAQIYGDRPQAVRDAATVVGRVVLLRKRSDSESALPDKGHG